MVSGIILAEGRVPERSDLERMLNALHTASVLDVVVVLGRQSKSTCDSFARWYSGKYLVDEGLETGLHHSIPKGFDALDQDDLHGAIVCPIAQFPLSQEIVVDLLQAFWKSHKKLIVPLVDGGCAPPVILDRTIIEEMKTGARYTSIEEIVTHYRNDVIEVPIRIDSTWRSEH